jgi:hypothetical protein
MFCQAAPWLPIQLAPEDCDLKVASETKLALCHWISHAAENRGFGTMLGPMNRF